MSESHCKQLLEYLLSRLDNSTSSNIKCRVLKVIEYLLKNGNEEIGHELRKSVASIQAALGLHFKYRNSECFMKCYIVMSPHLLILISRI